MKVTLTKEIFNCLTPAAQRDFILAGNQVGDKVTSDTVKATVAKVAPKGIIIRYGRQQTVMTRAAFERLSAGEKQEHFRKGGRLED